MKKKSVAAYIDLIVCFIVVVIGFIGAKIILFDLSNGTFNKEFNDIGIVMVIVFILYIVVFGMQIPKTIKELKSNWFLVSFLIFFTACNQNEPELIMKKDLDYPNTKKIEFSDTYFETQIEEIYCY